MHQFDTDAFGRPRLNFDVLRIVCNSLTDVSDVLSFALICSALTEDAFRRRLRMSPVNLEREESVDSFGRFIFTDEAARAPYIYGLKLPYASQYTFDTIDLEFWAIIDRIVPILRAAVHLKYIEFPSALDRDPPHPALTAAANMTSLRELYITFERDSPWKLLGTFRSPLRSLRLDDGDVDDEGITARLFHDHLGNFASTLEVLHLESIDFNIPPALVTTQFTAVRSLTIYVVYDFNQFTMEVLLRLFPNLNDTLVLGHFETTHAEHLYPHWRESSMEAQMNHVWPRLDHVEFDVRLAFLIALQCPIRRMDLRASRHGDKPYLAPTLRNNYPQRLHCVVRLDDSLGDLEELLPSEGADNLTHLVMWVNLRIGWPEVKDTQAPWSQFKDKLIASMRHLRLAYLRLVFHYDVLQKHPERDPIYTAGEMDLLPAAIQFAGTIPTLQYIFLTTCGNIRVYPRRVTSSGSERSEMSKWLASKAWRVDHNRTHSEYHPGPSKSSNAEADRASYTVTELNGITVERIIDREELHSLDYEERVLQEWNDSDIDSET